MPTYLHGWMPWKSLEDQSGEGRVFGVWAAYASVDIANSCLVLARMLQLNPCLVGYHASNCLDYHSNCWVSFPPLCFLLSKCQHWHGPPKQSEPRWHTTWKSNRKCVKCVKWNGVGYPSVFCSRSGDIIMRLVLRPGKLNRSISIPGQAGAPYFLQVRK